MKRSFVILIVLSFVAELAISLTLIGKMEDVKQDTVTINECVHSVADNYGNLSAYSTKLEYVLLTPDGSVEYQNGEGLSKSLNEAVKNGDTIVDLVIGGETYGKLIFKNQTKEIIKEYRKELTVTIIIISAVQLLIVISYFIYLRLTIIRPFEKLDAFAVRVAGGNLDTPLELDRKHIFGSFTEAFDLMRSELKKARAAEKRAMDEKKEMVAKLSHDIKTPVASIKSTSELGYELAGDERSREKFNLINAKSDQITALVTNLFNSSINDITEIEVNPSEQPSSIIAELVENADYRRRAGAFAVPACRIFADRMRLLQTFDNLFMNSYKYADTDISVTVSRERFDDTEYLVVCIADAGPGVTDEELPLLKEKYMRGGNKTDKDGAGLGLYLANYYIEKMNGRLVLENLEPGFAAKVYLRII
ncbi:MAG: hypothetical protein K5848_01705 [Lachnospiraceae bacterium]|nr:hypothetical protein [Lachnospiraceae bacterium]